MPAIHPLFAALRDDQYRIGNCSIRVYDRRDTKTYGTNFLHYLYDQCLSSAPHRPWGVLPEAFCGMSDMSADSICSYLASRSPLLLYCVDRADNPAIFDVIGFAYPTIWCGESKLLNPTAERSLFIGYTGFRQWWGSPELEICTMLMGVYFFAEFNLLSINGQRYLNNHLSAKYLTRFGVRDTGYAASFINQNGKLVDCWLSALKREDFERVVEKKLMAMVTVSADTDEGQL